MSIRRLGHLLAARWWALSLVAVAGLASAMAIAAYANSQIEPRFTAEASVVLLTGDEESEEVFDGRLATALVRARQANATVLANEPGSSIAVDKDSGELLFVAVSTSSADAETLVEDLREAYASVAPASFVEQLEQELDATAAKVELLEKQIAALEPQPPVLDAATTARSGFLESQIAALEARAAALALVLAYPELADRDPEEADRDPEEITAELAGLETQLIRLNRQLEALAPEETKPFSSADRLAKLALDQRLRNSEARYLDLAVRLATAKEAGGLSEEVVVISDETPSPLPLPLAALAGFLAGAAIAAALLLLVDRVRRPVWDMEGLEAIPGLGVVPASRPDASSVAPWYPTAGADPRRLALQRVRAALEGAVPHRPVTLAITGLRAPSNEVHALAADLASAVAAAGNEVLLVDANFQSPSALPEFGVDNNVDLATLLAHPDIDAEATRSFIKETLVNLRPTEGRLKGLSAGASRLDFSDALAGRHFELLVEEARGLVDMALMVAPGLGHPDADALCSRLDYVVVVGQAGVTTELDVEEAVRSLDLRGAHPVGLVLIGRSRRRGNRSRSRHGTKRRLESWVRRPGRLATRSRSPGNPGVEGNHTIDIPTVPLSPGVTLDGETPGQPSGQAQDILTSRLLSLLDRESRASRRRHGVIPLVEGCGASTAGELLGPILEAWLSEDGNGRTVRYDDLFGDPGTDTPQEALQRWLLDGFFADHVASTGHRPVVWHLSSRRGTFQALVHGPTFGRSTIRRIRRQLLGSQQRRLVVRAMSGSGRTEERNRLRSMLAELDDFDLALGQLLAEAKGWPSRRTFLGEQEATDDVRARFAAVQRLGLLPIEVLDEQELDDMIPHGP